MTVCTFCQGDPYWKRTAYDKSQWSKCPRCNDTRAEPEHPRIHSSLLLRNVRSGKVWAVFGWYDPLTKNGVQEPEGTWGIHRMKPSRRGGYYVWQILHRAEGVLLDPRRWQPCGYGDAWDHEKMETDPALPRH